MLSKQQIGKAGELLVQYRLLLLGIESSQMTTDAGIDLVAYLPKRKTAITIQVKTNLMPKPGGGKGSLSLDWWIPCDSPAQLCTFVDLKSERVWILKTREIESIAQQKSGGRWHLYIYTGKAKTKKKWATEHEMMPFEFHRRQKTAFGVIE